MSLCYRDNVGQTLMDHRWVEMNVVYFRSNLVLRTIVEPTTHAQLTIGERHILNKVANLGVQQKLSAVEG